MSVTISGSVGVGGKNNPDDVLVIQQLLNAVPEHQGGPPSPIAEDGLVGPQTVGAIRRFQLKNFGFGDGRVDLNGQTLPKLGGMAAPGMAKRSTANKVPNGNGPNNGQEPKFPDILAMLISAQGGVFVDAPGASYVAQPGESFPPIGVILTTPNGSAFVRFHPSGRMVHVPPSSLFYLDQAKPISTMSGPQPNEEPAPYYQVGKTQPSPAPYYRVGKTTPTSQSKPAPHYQAGKPAQYYQVGK